MKDGVVVFDSEGVEFSIRKIETLLEPLARVARLQQPLHHATCKNALAIAGSTMLGDFTVVGGHAAIAPHLSIGTGAQIAAASGVMHDVPPGGHFAGIPASRLDNSSDNTRCSSRLPNERREIAARNRQRYC